VQTTGVKGSEVLLSQIASRRALSEQEAAAIRAVAGGPVRSLPKGRDLLTQGELPTKYCLVVGGWAYAYKILEDGRRQILSLLLPGDICDIGNLALRRMDHSVGALTSLSVVDIAHVAMRQMMAEHPNIAEALWTRAFVAASIQREWTLNLGQRSAVERIAHLFCELLTRLGDTGNAADRSFHLPLRQSDIADATGLTTVHVNRVLKQLRDGGLITLSTRTLQIHDFAGLSEIALFTPDYLSAN
jgi:CRP-like cAMP-binding protein